MSEIVSVAMGRCSRCGELWPACKCGRPTPPTGGFERPTPTPGSFVEWVQWKTKSGSGLSLYHVRVTSSGWLLCGRRAGESAAANSSPPVEQKCAVCLGKLAS